MIFAEPQDVGCNVTTALPPKGRFGSDEGVEDIKCFERSSAREPSVTPGPVKASLDKVDGTPKRLLAKQPL